jgi:hypothetical protein
MLTERFIPSDCKEYLSSPEHQVIVYASLDRLVAVGYVGKSKKFSFNYRFKNLDQIQTWTKKWFDDACKNVQDKIDRKEEIKKINEALDLTKELKVNDVVVSTWGWEQTQADMYQIMEIKNKRVLLKRICGDIVEHNCSMSGYKMPCLNDFYKIDDEKNEFWSTVKAHSWNGNKSLTFSGFASYEHAHLWDGEKVYVSWYA